MAKTVFDVLDEKVVELQASQEQMIYEGAPKDFPSYREYVGVIRGLALARREIADLSQNYRDD
jgi:hypothetical protein|tara:strand:- start:904 stop:1092 length:189 start_codon:yes stop_codon:yes gene_type:complete